MSCKIIVTDNFKREAKPLLKKYSSLRHELEVLQKSLIEAPRMGARIAENVYKIRIAVKSKGRGKSGGLRIITFVWEVSQEDAITIFLASVYDKSDEENISDKDLERIIDEIIDNINEE
jgi:hypothetical protein